MQVRVEPYSSSFLKSIQRFNERLREAGVEEGFCLPERTDALESGPAFETMPSAPLSKRHFLLVDEHEVRGGFILQDQKFEVCGKRDWVTNIQMPVSEGVVDRRFTHLAVVMLRLILKRTPRAYAVGMGGMDQPFPRLLAASRWHVEPVPFWFYVLEPRRFLKEIRLLRKTRVRTIGSQLAASTGLGSVAIRLLHAGASLAGGRLSSRSPGRVRTNRFDHWGSWADSVWASYRLNCSFAAVRDFATLPLFHPLTGSLAGYRFDREGQVLGWSAVQVTPMRDNRFFGDLRVATILDSLSLPGFEGTVMRSTLAAIRDCRVDLVVANQLHGRALQSMREVGFLQGPSNFICASSPQLHAEVRLFDAEGLRRHVSRADGDGRIHL